jgi:glutathione S-transferase
LQAAQRDLEAAFAATEELLGSSSAFAFGDTPGVVEFALWPHLSAVKPLGFVLDEQRYPATVRWLGVPSFSVQ